MGIREKIGVPANNRTTSNVAKPVKITHADAKAPSNLRLAGSNANEEHYEQQTEKNKHAGNKTVAGFDQVIGENHQLVCLPLMGGKVLITSIARNGNLLDKRRDPTLERGQ
uniref:Uncharacterized protein n=1 Tax=Romanomermis culicivorax TaxID=13658 RepID=A0A915IPW2_ROMCU